MTISSVTQKITETNAAAQTAAASMAAQFNSLWMAAASGANTTGSGLTGLPGSAGGVATAYNPIATIASDMQSTLLGLQDSASAGSNTGQAGGWQTDSDGSSDVARANGQHHHHHHHHGSDTDPSLDPTQTATTTDTSTTQTTATSSTTS